MNRRFRFLLLGPVVLYVGLLGCASQPNDETGRQLSSDQVDSARYVSPDGKDENSGGETHPWRTLQHAADQARPGDTILIRDGVYAETLVVSRSGNPDNGFITFTNYPGETPVIDGSSVELEQGFSALVLVNDQEYVRIEGFEIRNYRSTDGEQVPVGILITGSGSHIEILNNDVHHIEANGNGEERDAHGIAVYGTQQSPINDVLIDGNEVHDLTLGTSEALVINGNVKDFVISGNEVHDNDNIGIDIIGFEEVAPSHELDRARDGVVRGNLVYNIDSGSNDSYSERSAGGIYVDGGTRILIEDNIVHHANLGIEIASEHPGADTSFITVKNNLLHHNHLVGLALGGYDELRGKTTNSEIMNNTIVYNDTDSNGNGELLLQFDVTDNVFHNNIFVAGDQGILIANPFTENRNNTFEANLYYTESDPDWQWRKQSFTSWEDYVASTGNDRTSIFADPQFLDETSFDYRLSPSSPMLEIGYGSDGHDN